MALNWHIGNIKDFEKVCLTPEGKVSGKTEYLILATMTVQLGGITEKNWQEFYCRLDFCKRLLGFLRNITEEDVKSHIGLHTNVSDSSWPKFQKSIVKAWMDGNRWFPNTKKKVKGVR